jgi:hypothetical protein
MRRSSPTPSCSRISRRRRGPARAADADAGTEGEG